MKESYDNSKEHLKIGPKSKKKREKIINYGLAKARELYALSNMLDLNDKEYVKEVNGKKYINPSEVPTDVIDKYASIKKEK